MAKRIQKSEIAESNLFGDIKKSAEDTIEVINKLSEALNDTAKAVKESVGGAKFDSTKAVDRFVKSTEKANKLQKQAIQLDKEKAKAVEARKKAMSAQQKVLQEQEKTVQQRIKTEEQLKRQKERANKEGERAKRVAEAEASAYKKLVAETRKLKNQSKELGAKMLQLEKAGKKNTTQYRQLTREYREVTKQAKAGDKALKGLDGTVGDNFRNVGNYVGALKKLGGAFVAMAGGFGVMRLMRGAVDIVVNFDQAVGDLAAISGKSKEELSELTDQAKELGATTQFSATQITEMQIELAKLGFTSDQIMDSTVAVSNFAAATGADIPSAAKLAGSALRGFGLEAEEMERVVSVLGVATTKSALDFSALSTGLSTVAPVAKSFGFSIEDTTALLAQLANAGFDASSAATATRNILLKMADSGGDLAQALGRPITSADELAGALQELKAKGIDLSEALELTDKRSVAAFSTFLEGSDTLVEMRDSITDVNDELEAMAEKRLDTIGGQFTLLQSAWEGFILSVNEGSGVGETFKSILGFLAENLGSIMTHMGRVVGAIILYQSALIAARTWTFLFSGGLQSMFVDMIKAVKGFKLMGRGAKSMGKSVQSAGRMMNAVPWVLIISLAIELAMALYNAASGANDLARAQERLARANAQAEASVDKLKDKVSKKHNEEMRLLDIEQRKKMDLAKTDKERAKIAEETLKEKQKITKGTIKTFTDEIKWRKKMHSEIAPIVDKLNKARETGVTLSGKERLEILETIKKYPSLKKISLGQISTNQVNTQSLEILTEATDRQIASLTLLNEGKKTYTDQLDELTTQEHEHNNQLNLTPKKIKKINTELKTQIDLLDELNDLLGEQLGLENDLEQVQLSRGIKGLDKRIKMELEAQRASAESTGEIDVDLLESLILQKSQMKQEAIKRDAEFEMSELDRLHALRFQSLRRQLAEELELKKLQLGISPEQVAKLEKQAQEVSRKIDAIEMEASKNLALQKKLIAEESKNDILDIKEEEADEIKAINDELIGEQEAYAVKQAELSTSTAKTVTDIEKQMWQDRMDMAQVATDILVRMADKRIEKLDEEIQKATQQADHLRALAESGNIDAKESLAEQQRIIDEANRKKMEEERLKAKIEFMNVVMQTYGQKVQQDSQNPLADTIKDVSLLQQFIAQFTPTFKEGTEDTGAHGMGIDGEGGFHAILHPNERVLTKEQNKRIGALSNDSLAKVAQDYQNGKITQEGASQMGSGWDSHLIVKRLVSLEQTIKDKPEHNLAVEDVVTGAMTIVRETKKGNTLNFNRYRVKK